MPSGKVASASLLLRSISPDLRWLASLGRNAEIKLIAACKEESRTCADRRGNSLEQGIVVRVTHLVNADRGLTARNVDSFAGNIKKEIVGVSRSAHPGHLFVRLRGQDNQHGRLPSDCKEAVVF